MSNWIAIPAWTSIPALNALGVGAPAAVPQGNHNAVEVRGRCTAGSGRLILLRKIQYTASSFRYVPFKVDKASVPMEDARAGGFFCDQYVISDFFAGESFALLNNAGEMTFGTGVDQGLWIRGIRV